MSSKRNGPKLLSIDLQGDFAYRRFLFGLMNIIMKFAQHRFKVYNKR